MSKWGRTEYECKCEYVIKGREKKKKLVVRYRIVTVPHCYPSVVRNTLEITIKIGIRIKVQFIVNVEGTHVMMRGGSKVNVTPRTEVTMIVTGGAAAAMGLDTVVKTMRGVGGSISLIDVRKAMCTRRGDVHEERRCARGEAMWT